MQHPKAVQILLRISIASVFLYAALAATLQPQNWLFYIPQFAKNMVPAPLLLGGFSLYQVVLSLWLLSGKKTLYAALLASLTLIGIIAVNLSVMDIVFRDLAIFFAALALAVGSYKKK